MAIVRLLLRGIFETAIRSAPKIAATSRVTRISNIAEGADQVPGQCWTQSRTAGCSN